MDTVPKQTPIWMMLNTTINRRRQSKDFCKKLQVILVGH
jgi:hypothetical protein